MVSYAAPKTKDYTKNAREVESHSSESLKPRDVKMREGMS